MEAPSSAGSLPAIKPFYRDGLITIYHGDCRQIVPRLEQVDLLLTDPPYGIGVCPRGTIGSNPTITSKRRSRVRARCTRFKAVTWDSEPPRPWVLQMLIERARWAVLWGGNYYTDLAPSAGWLVWDKRVPKGVGFADCELAWTNHRKAVRIFRWRWSGMLQEDMENKEVRVHPTQKPVPLMQWCISRFNPVRSILDPFMGSGSTLLAAQRLGIPAVGIDQDESYCAAAVSRLLEDRNRVPQGAGFNPQESASSLCFSAPLNRPSSGSCGPVPARLKVGRETRRSCGAGRSCGISASPA